MGNDDNGYDDNDDDNLIMLLIQYNLLSHSNICTTCCFTISLLFIVICQYITIVCGIYSSVLLLTTIGPTDTLYEGGFFQAILEFPPDFPNMPPVMTFKSEMWHPNGMSSCKH